MSAAYASFGCRGVTCASAAVCPATAAEAGSLMVYTKNARREFIMTNKEFLLPHCNNAASKTEMFIIRLNLFGP